MPTECVTEPECKSAVSGLSHKNASSKRHRVANTQLFSPAIQILNNVSPFTLSNSEFEQGTRDFEQTKNQTPAQG